MTPRRALMASILCLIAVAATFDAWADIVRNAVGAEFIVPNHSLLVLPAAFWLAWVRRGRLRHLRPAFSATGAAIALAGAAMYYLVDETRMTSTRDCGALLIAIGCVVAVIGRELLKSLLPAILMLFFMVPMPARVHDVVASPLHAMILQMTTWVCAVSGVDVNWSEYSVAVVNGSPSHIVADVHYGTQITFAVAIAFCTFAFSRPLRWRIRLLLVAVGPVLALLCAVLQLTSSIGLEYRFSSGAGIHFYLHSNWFFFFAALLALMGIVRLLKRAMIPLGPFTLASD